MRRSTSTGRRSGSGRRSRFEDLTLSADDPPREFTAGDVTFQIGSRWRPFGSAYLVTVHARVVTAASGDTKADAARTLYQVELSVVPGPGGRILEYDPTAALDVDAEAAELRLRYRNARCTPSDTAWRPTGT